MEEVRQRLDAVSARRDKAARNKERAQGRLDSARNSLASVEAEIREKGVEPEKIDEMIEAVERKLEKLVVSLEGKMDDAERDLAPFLEDEK